MLKRKKVFVSFVAILFVLMITGGIFRIFNRGSDSKATKKLLKQMEVQVQETKEDQNGLILEAEVVLPDYSEIFKTCYEDAEADAQNEKQFEKNLYKLAVKAAKKSDEKVVQTVKVALSELDAEKTDWSEKELKEAACQAALETEIEEFCIAILAEEIPREVYEEVTLE